MGIKDLFVDMTIDIVYAYVIQRNGVSKVHRAPFDGTAAQMRAACGARAKGYWCVVSAEYNEQKECLNCRRVVAKLTHGSKK
jgi:hypothetical protein